MEVMHLDTYMSLLQRFPAALRRLEQSSALLLVAARGFGYQIARARKVSAVNNDIRIRNFTGLVLAGDISINRFLHLASTRVMNVFDQFII